MKKSVRFTVITGMVMLLTLLGSGPGRVVQCRADVLFIHDHHTTEFVLGDQEARLQVAVTAGCLWIGRFVTPVTG